MEDRTIRASMKTVWFAYVIALLLFVAAEWAAWKIVQENSYPFWFAALPLVVFLFPIKMHTQRRLITLKLHDGHLTIESGFLSSTRRTVDLAKIQDVTVKQTFGQRMLGVGDLMLESAGEGGAMGMQNLDRPRQIADTIIQGSKEAQRRPL